MRASPPSRRVLATARPAPLTADPPASAYGACRGVIIRVGGGGEGGLVDGSCRPSLCCRPGTASGACLACPFGDVSQTRRAHTRTLIHCCHPPRIGCQYVARYAGTETARDCDGDGALSVCDRMNAFTSLSGCYVFASTTPGSSGGCSVSLVALLVPVLDCAVAGQG